MKPIITLTTDFGQKDGFIGVMKGVIWGIVQEVQIADITHEIEPQNIRQGAYALWRAVPFFPEGSVHIAVIDPGVGTQRRPIGLRIGNQYYIVPDNGLITPFLEDGESAHKSIEIVHLNNPDYWLPEVSRTFHGRDIFAPTGAHLAKGVPLNELGSPISDPVRLAFSKPEQTDRGWVAHITIIDVFGNLTTDLPAEYLSPDKEYAFKIGDQTIQGLVPSYGHRAVDELIAVVDSENYIEISVVNGNAAKATGSHVGDIVEVILND